MPSRLARAAVVLLVAAASHAQPLPSVDRYDPARDAVADLDAALAAAPAAGREVLVVVGGDWCRDCRDLDALFAADPALAALRDARYVQVKVHVGTDNRNAAALARLPHLAWVPTLVVLDARGSVVRHAASTAFHAGKALDPARIAAFLAGETAPPRSP